jgi:energy-coupling factor transporter ATP-binding protein EcfA2
MSQSVRSLRVTHFAGVRPETAFHIPDFSPGVNVLHGPNGSGKTTSARALQSLLWPRLPFRDVVSLEADLEIDGTAWRFATRGHGLAAWREGVELPPPSPAHPEGLRQHAWSLQDLLENDDNDLARRIAQLLSGGVNFAKVADACGWSSPTPSPRGLATERQALQRSLRETQQAQNDLLQQAASLDPLRRERDACLQRAARRPLVDAALRRLRDEARLQQLRAQLDQAPPHMQALREEDPASLQLCLESLRDLETRLHAARESLRALGPGETTWALLPDADFQRTRLQLDALLHEASRARDAHESALRRLEETEAREQALRKRLGLRSLPLFEAPQAFPEFRAVADAQHRAAAARAEADALAHRVPVDNLDPAPPEHDPDAVRLARLNLEAWLQHCLPPPRRATALFWITLALVAALALVLANVHNARWYLLLLFPLLAGFAQIHLARDSRRRQREDLQSRHPDTLPTPDDWSPASVRDTLQQLETLLVTLHRNRLAAEDAALALRARQQADAAEAALDQALESLRGSGLDVLTRDPLLPHFLQDLRDWRAQRTDCAAAEAALDAASDRETEALAALHHELQPWIPGPPPATFADASRLVRDCALRLDAERSRRQTLRETEASLRGLEERHAETSTRRDALCTRLGLAEPDPAELRRRVALLPEWKRAFRESEDLDRSLSDLRKTLADSPDLSSAAEADLLRLAEDAQRDLDEAARLLEAITRLDERIRHASRQRTLHEALEQRSRIDARIADLRTQQLHSEAGRAVLDWLRDTCRSQEQPRVLLEANRNLALFSNGALELGVARDGDTERFTAAQPGHPPRPLSTLSTGERAQLLMAVRLAFVTQQEQSPMPLFVDEALGTSDETRARAIMRAIALLARGGRQMFVFTAQRDEAAKWRQVLADSATPHRVIDLAALRARGEQELLLLPPGELPEDPARRGGESLAEWLQRIGTPPANPWHPPENLALWHVLPDENQLAPLLRHGLRRWGDLHTLAAHNAAASLLTPEALQQARARAAAFAAFAEAWRIGRARPLSPAELLDTQCVSETFVPDMLRLLEEVKGDPPALLAALEAGRLPRWRKSATERLNEVLERDNRLPRERPLDDAELRAFAYARLQAANLFDPTETYTWALP